MMIHDGLVWSLQSGGVVVDLYFVAGLFIGFAALGLSGGDMLASDAMNSWYWFVGYYLHRFVLSSWVAQGILLIALSWGAIIALGWMIVGYIAWKAKR